MSDEIKIQLVGDTKSFDSAVDASLSRAEGSIKNKLEKPLDSAMNKAKKGIKDGLETPVKQASGFASDFTSAFAGMALPNIASGIYVAEKAMSALSYAGEEFFNLFKGEKLLKIEKQFDAMASSFGLSGDIATAFNARAGGLVEDDQMMQSLTEKLITFDGHIQKMPELFTQARKAANLFGGDALDMFEKMSFAAQTGNTRSLRFIFPKLDLDKEIDKYAVSHGKLASEVTETEKQQVRLNLILSEAEKRLKGVSAESTSAESGWKRLKIAIGDIGDETSKATAKNGGFFANFFHGMADLVKGGPKAISEITSLSEAMDNQAMVIRKLKFLENDLAEYRKTLAGKARGDDPYTVAKINSLKALNKQYDEYIKKQKDVEKAEADSAAKADAAAKNGAMSKGRLTAIDEINNQLRDKMEQARMVAINGKLSEHKTMANLDALNAAKELQEKTQLENDKLAVLKDYLSKGLILEQQYQRYRSDVKNGKDTGNTQIDNSIQVVDDTFEQKKLERTRWYAEQQKQIADQVSTDALANQASFQNGWFDGFKGFSGLVVKNAQELQKNYSKTMASLAAQSMSTFSSGVGGAIKNMTLAFRNGQDGLQAFGEAFLATIGDMMVQMGSGFISMAIPMLIVSDPRGGPLMAAGAGLIAAGTLLSASVGNGSTQGLGGTTGNAGGGVSGGTVDPGTTKAYRPDDLAEVKQQPKIEVNFAGNLLNNKESALYIAEVLQEAAFSNDIKFAGV